MVAWNNVLLLVEVKHMKEILSLIGPPPPPPPAALGGEGMTFQKF